MTLVHSLLVQTSGRSALGAYECANLAWTDLACPLDYIRRYMSFRFLDVAHRSSRGIRIVNSGELLPCLVSRGIPEEKLEVLYSVYLDRAVFRPLPDVRKDYDVIFVGRLVPNKGLPLLIKAFELVR